MNKNEESIYVNWFADQMGWKNYIITCGERPDFIINNSCKRIGLEVTNFYRDEGKKGSKLKAKESYSQDWLKKLSYEYYRKSNCPIQLSVLLISGTIDNIDSTSLIGNILSHIPENEFECNEFEVYSNNIEVKYFVTLLPKQFSNYKKRCFVNDHVGSLRDIKSDELKRKVDLKIEKSHNYTGDYDELNLLIVIDAITNSGKLKVSNTEFNVSCNEFANIYLGFYPEKIVKIG